MFNDESYRNAVLSYTQRRRVKQMNTTRDDTTIENYCIDCKAIAQPNCDSCGHIIGTLGHVSPTPSSDFDEVFEQLESPDYPATCDNCGAEGTNASMKNHVCLTRDEAMGKFAQRVVEGVVLTRSQIGWQTERLPIHGMRIVDNTGRLIAADVYDEKIAEQIVREHNATLTRNESPAPRAGEGDHWIAQGQFVSDCTETLSGMFAVYGSDQRFIGAFSDKSERNQLVTEHNQHATLVEQRDRLLVIVNSFGWHSQSGEYSCWCHIKSDFYAKHTDQCQSIRETIATIEQEGKL